MIRPDAPDNNSLGSSRPRFLDELDRDPIRAFRTFHDFARRLLTTYPPPAMRAMSKEDREDAISEVLLHCLKENMRVLRRYEDRGRPFAHWLLVVAQYRVLDLLRRNRRRTFESVEELEPWVFGRESRVEMHPDDRAFLRQNLEVVMRLIRQMELRDQILLLASAEGYRPRDLASLLGLPRSAAKRLSDELRYCRTRLKMALKRKLGMEWEDLLPSTGTHPRQPRRGIR